MIAKRPERSNVLDDELFAGMTFPEVPRGPILIKPTSYEQPFAQNIELTTFEKKYSSEEQDISQFLDGESETTNLIQKDKTDGVRFQTNFSTLYRIEDSKPETVKYYPELPILTSSKKPTQQVQVEQVGEAVKSDSDLVESLIEENSKLRNELADLRLLLAEKAGTSVTSQTQNSNATSSETKTQSTGNMKYVCCGSCKQWLVAPKASTYVICSNCKAVNNCSLVQGTQVPIDSNNPSTNVNQSSNGWFPWFMECFTPSFS